MSEQFVYQGIWENETPSQDYLTSNAVRAKRQIAKGGYRLAQMLTGMFDSLKLYQK